MTSVTEHPVDAGHAALDRGDWPSARASFEAGLDGERHAEALDGLAWVGWWESDAQLCLGSREAAFRAYGGTGAQAAEAAGWLATDQLEFRGDDAVAKGWVAQAHRALDDVREGPSHAWVLLHEAYILHAVDNDSGRAAELARRATAIGREHGVTDVEAIGLATGGLALVAVGDVQAGLRSLDAAVALVTTADLERQVTVAWALCMMLSACARLGDVPRAEQWSARMKEFAERYDSRHLLGSCRVSYGHVMSTGGHWQTAEAELTAAVDDLSATRAGMASGGLARLGLLRLRQGRTGEARSLFEQALPSVAAVIGLGEIALGEDDAASARDAAERALRRSGSATLDRLPPLELLVRAAAALGDLPAARTALAELDEIAAAAGTPYLAGRASRASAQVALAEGDAEAARRCAEDAVDSFTLATAPYDAARAREVLARALTALGRAEHAQREAGAARDVLSALGAAPEPVAPSGAAGSELTAREIDVLRLVAQGLSDAEVAERLIVSPHTVHRHVANIRAKLRLPSRAAAVAYAARERLI